MYNLLKSIVLGLGIAVGFVGMFIFALSNLPPIFNSTHEHVFNVELVPPQSPGVVKDEDGSVVNREFEFQMLTRIQVSGDLEDLKGIRVFINNTEADNETSMKHKSYATSFVPLSKGSFAVNLDITKAMRKLHLDENSKIKKLDITFVPIYFLDKWDQHGNIDLEVTRVIVVGQENYDPRDLSPIIKEGNGILFWSEEDEKVTE